MPKYIKNKRLKILFWNKMQPFPETPLKSKTLSTELFILSGFGSVQRGFTVLIQDICNLYVHVYANLCEYCIINQRPSHFQNHNL